MDSAASASAWDTIGQIVGVATGLALVYTLLSLICSTINEIVFGMLGVRARMLRASLAVLLQGIREESLPTAPAGAAVNPGFLVWLFSPSQWSRAQDEVVEFFFRMPLARRFPSRFWYRRDASYLNAAAFSQTLLDLIAPSRSDTPRTWTTVRAALATSTLIDEELRTTVLGLWDNTKGDFVKSRAAIEHWFDDAMEEVRGLYRSRSQFCILLFAAAACTVLNVDTVRIGKELWNDREARAAVTRAAQKYIDDSEASQGGPNYAPDHGQMAGTPPSDLRLVAIGGPRSSANESALVFPDDAPPPEGAPAPSGPRPKPPTNEFREKMATMRKQMDELAQLRMPIGWESEPPRISWPSKLAGLIISTFAVSLGAPFWFDLLNKLVSLRTTAGDKPETTSQRQSAKD